MRLKLLAFNLPFTFLINFKLHSKQGLQESISMIISTSKQMLLALLAQSQTCNLQQMEVLGEQTRMSSKPGHENYY